MNKPIPFFSYPVISSLVIISVIWVSFNQALWKKTAVIQHDTNNYYSYLPAYFYENDLSLSFLDDTINKQLEGRYYWPNRTTDGKPIIKMSMGMAISYLPFFAMAHVYANISGDEVNGFSPPYHFAIHFSSLFYYMIGLLFLWKILRLHFNERISFLALFCISFATNVFYYLTIQSGLSHIVGFAFIAMFVYYTIQWHQNFKWKYILALGLIGGFLTLVRPINFLIFILFAVYGILTWTDFKNKCLLFWKHKEQFFLLCFSAFVMVLPQLLYWKHVTGHYFFNSYIKERFYFDSPHVLNALFGFRKGWLIYTPIMVFSVIGFFKLKGAWKQHRFSFAFFMLIYIYVTFSWWCWWYGGSFSQRPMIDVYPILAIPLATFLSGISTQKRGLKRITISCIVFFTALNLFQTMQAKYNIIHYDSMTFKNYIRIFGSTSRKPDRQKYLDIPDYEYALEGKEEREEESKTELENRKQTGE
jgi:hypothetical protein